MILVGTLSFILLLNMVFTDPNTDVPETHKLGWCPYQQKLNIQMFRSYILENNSDQSNPELVLRYEIWGQIPYDEDQKPYIKEVHISERFLKKDSLNDLGAEIQITPIVAVKKVAAAGGGSVEFKISNKLVIKTMHPGKNKVNVKCAQFGGPVELIQGK